MIIQLGLGLTHRSTADGTVFVPQTQIAITPFTRDKTLFDSGAAFGRNAASVPLRGTGTAGETVQLRLIFDDGASTPWEDLVQVAPDGQWQGTATQARSATWIRPEVRIKSEPVTRQASTTRFGVGHVIALWGQSEIVRIRSEAHDLSSAAPLLADDMVQAIFSDGAPVVKHLTAADPHTAALAAMANTFLATRANDKVAVVFQAKSGTGIRALVDDSDTGRDWADDAALHAFATADGQHVGMPAMSWFASPGALGDLYDDSLFPLMTGKMLDGTPVAFPTTLNTGTGLEFTANHWFGELYDPAHTRWVPYGPHRFDIGEDMQSATVTALGAQQDNLSNKQQAREAWRSMVANPNAGTWFLPLGLEPLAYQNGVPDGTGGWTDGSHPADDTPDGAARFAQLTAHAVLQASGLATWQVPEFDQCAWEATGAYVEVWSSAGPITTLRTARQEAPLQAGFPHWTRVFGWQINGFPAERAELVAGRVRIFPVTGSFTASDVISYGEGGATGMVKFPEDLYAHAYKDIPLVDVGASGVEGIELRPLPNAAVLQNTLPASEPSFTTTATGPHFVDPVALGAGVSGLYLSLDLTISLPASGARTLATTTGNYLKLESLPDGSLRARVRDEDGIVKVDNFQTNAGVLIDSTRAEVVMNVDMVAGFARVWVNGTQVMDETFVMGSGLLPGNRKLLLLATNTGAYQVEATIFGLSVWKTAGSGLTPPTSAPYKTISGIASTVNGDSWKQGDDAL